VTVPTVLIVDDDPALLEALPEALRLRMGEVTVETCDSAPDALARIAVEDYDAIITDIKMPGMDGLALLDEIQNLRPETPTLLITGHGEHDLAIQALRRGAYDYIQKPIDREYFTASLSRAIEKRSLARRVELQRLELERHAHVLEHVGDGVFVVDREGIVRFWNLAAEQITGIALGRAVGTPARQLLGGWDEASPSIPVAGGGRPKRHLARMLPFEVDGREVWLSLCGVDVADATVYSFQDRTDERVLDKVRDDFVATASHELRTPLAAVYGAAQTLRRHDFALDEAGRERFVSLIVDESERLGRIVNDILLANQLDVGALEVRSEVFDPGELVDRVVEAARTHVPSLPPVASDRDRVRQVLTNLLENAIKYSPAGGRVEVGVSSNGDMIRFFVRDEGLGIPEDEQKRIFDKFYRLDPQMAGGVGGTGLGLYICNELVQRMGGRIWVESAGEGSTFQFEVPASETMPARPVLHEVIDAPGG
jgi:PAS domain S-box-containing protein